MDPSFFCNSTKLDPNREWCVKFSELNYAVMCYKQTLLRKEGLWRAENATSLLIPTFLSQLVLIISINHLLMFAFRPLRLPRITAEILGGVILGAGGVAGTMFGKDYLFPYRAIMTLETVANLGLLYYMLLLGLEVDLKPVIQAPKKAFTIALSGLLLTFPVGVALHYMVVENFTVATDGLPTRYGPLFWGIALSTTNFPELAQILIDLKLLRSEVGRTALSAAVMTDLTSWLLFVVCMAVINTGHVYTLVLGGDFVVLSLFVFRPALSWAVGLTNQRIVEGGSGYNDYHISFILALAVAFGYVTDACGCHSILGGFMLGVIMPKGELKEKLMEKVEDFVLGLMMPLFFIVVGLRTNHLLVFGGQFGIGKIIGVLGLAFVAKIASTFLAAVFFNKMKFRDSLALGLLMNTKGLLTLIVISSARDIKVLNNQTFTILITALWLMTAAVGPILSFAYKSGKPSGEYKRSCVTSVEPHESELRILTCSHSSQEVTGIANLLDASNPTKESPISVFALHLVEHVGRASAMLIVHNACRIDETGGDKDDDSSAVAATSAFNDLKNGKELGSLFIHPLTVVSSFATMHEDICSLAEEKQTNLIILPFHLKPTTDGGVESTKGNPFRIMNKHVLENSPCSVAVLVDRGHRPPTVLAKLDNQGHLCRHFFVIFIGGPDDREALAYAQRMSGNPNIGLTVTRFSLDNENHVELSTDDEEKEEKLLDNQCLEEFRRETKNNSAVKLRDVVVRSWDEIVKVIIDMEGDEYDLIIQGGSCDSNSDTGCGGGSNDGASASNQRVENNSTLSEHFGPTTWEPTQIEKPDLASFVSRGTRSF
ncbi:Cation/H(+) antiporter 15 [Morus notabilis]|uniref:Cation/H(+) antiporter 15 n=1 Tax=Morus notabilis TaxID=981085 RepID=W9SXP8_9ROSA|nr:Cation/H(+) antiporter 15 [Morus notabilis]